MSNEKTKEALPFLLSDERIERMAGDPITAQAVSPYALGECIGRARGMASARDIYEAVRQRDKERIEELTGLVQELVDALDKCTIDRPDIDGTDFQAATLSKANQSGFTPSTQ